MEPETKEVLFETAHNIQARADRIATTVDGPYDRGYIDGLCRAANIVINRIPADRTPIIDGCGGGYTGK